MINNDYIMGFTGIWKYIPWREQKSVWMGSEKGSLNLFFFPISLVLLSPNQAVRTTNNWLRSAEKLTWLEEQLMVLFVSLGDGENKI